MSENGDDPRDEDGEPAGPASAAGPEPVDLTAISMRIAALSQDLSQLTQFVARAPARKLEIETGAAALKRLTDAYGANPEALAAAQHDLVARQTVAFQALSEAAFAGGANKPDASPNDVLTDNPFFGFVQSMFTANAEWAEQLALDAPGLTDAERRRAAFMLRQANAALSPANSLMGNPKALKAMFETDGQSIQQGLTNLQNDLNADSAHPSLKQTDTDAFRPGENLATTPGEVVLKNELIELIRYHPSTETVREVPILIFPPWINKFYVLDLTPANSLVAWLRDQGFTTYIVSWRSADSETREFDWDDYLRLGGRAALDFVSEAHGGPVNAAGYCVGGALLSLLAARLAEAGDDRLASVTLLAAQTDFSEPGDLGLFIDEASLPAVAAMIEESDGIMPGEAMREAFNLLRPEDLIWRYVEQRYLLGEEPKAFDLLYWNNDQTNLPGHLHLQSLHQLYLKNALARGQFEVEGAKVDLGAIECPVFIHAAKKDHISPFPSVYKGVHLFGGEVTFLLADSGHIAGVVNPPDAKKYRYWTGPGSPPSGYLAWEADASEHPGSWWPVWADWLSEWSGDEVAPPQPVKDAAPAPGAYVLETLASIREKDGR